MKQKLVHFTDEQIEYLDKIRSEHNISASAYIRLLLRDDMDGRQTSSAMVTFDASGKSVVRTSTTMDKDRTSRILKHKARENSKQTAVINELKSVLELRRIEMEKCAYSSPSIMTP